MLGQKRGTFLFECYFLTVAFEPVALVIVAERGQETAEASAGLTRLRQRQKASPLPELGVATPGQTGVLWTTARGQAMLGPRPRAEVHGQEGRASHGADSGLTAQGSLSWPSPTHPGGRCRPLDRPPWKHWLNRRGAACSLGAASRLAAQWLRRLGGGRRLGGWRGER